MDVADLHNLPIAKKLELVTKLWDDIASSREPLVVPPEIIAEAERRSAELKAEPSLGLDDDQLWQRVDG